MKSMTAISRGNERADSQRSKTWPAYAASGLALFYAAYRAYYALGGTIGMFGTPVSMHQWRVINGVGAAIILFGAVLPIAIMPLWRRERVRNVLLALCWVVAVGCIMHAVVDEAERMLSMAGVLHMDFPFWATRDVRESDLQDVLFNEPWFFTVGLMWGALGWFELRSPRSRRLWLTSGLLGVAALTTMGLLSAFGVIGKAVVG
jgi:hypothetical protein